MEVGVRLTVVGTEGEAEAICGLLRVNGIPSGHREVDSTAQGAGGWWHEVLVPEARLEEARELVVSPDES
jgi:Putative prokaryotic signal transducing protein